ncbi:EVE domain-containing protein [Pontibacter toksunensis]|uniref:EVE domain-containing protein n=1 Tax=Pontibacter toksunensis TaxID=1332631 RepID=A0ABW6C2T6_9BACT
MNYWAFHCNPSSWDSISELKEHNDGTWLIDKQHKNDIKVGDKFILWISGKEAGVYAFGEIADTPKLLPEAEERAKL